MGQVRLAIPQIWEESWTIAVVYCLALYQMFVYNYIGVCALEQ